MTGPLSWQQMNHAQIHALTQAGPGPAASTHAEDLWRRVAEIVTAGEAAMDRAVRDSEGMWEGSAGDGARTGLHELNSWARDAATDAANTTAAMGNQSVHAGHVRATVPEPYTAEYAAAERFANENPFDEGMQRAFLGAQDEKALRDEDARQKMAVYHYDSVRNRGLMDVWTTPPTVVVEAATAGPAALAGGAGAGGVGMSGADTAVVGAGAAGAGVGSGGVGAGGAALAGGAAGTAVGGGGSTGGAGLPAGASGADGAAAGAAAAAGRTGPGALSAGGVGTGTTSTRASGSSATSTGSGTTNTGSGGTGSGGTGGFPGAGAPGTGGASPGPAGGAGAGAGPGAGRSAIPGGRVPAPPPTGRDSLPPGAGGRGPRTPPLPEAATAAGGGVRPVVPRAPVPPAPLPTWRDLVAANRAPEPALRAPGDLAARPDLGRPGAGPTGPGPTSTPPPPSAPPGQSPRADGLRAAGGAGPSGHGFYPPAAGATSGATGETRRRAPYLVDDTGVFEVEDQLLFTEPVIRGSDRERPG